MHKNFLVLESNFLYKSLGIFGVICVKFIICGLISLTFYKANLQKTPFSQFFYVQLVVLLIFIQILAGLNNFHAKESIKEQLNENLGTNYSVSDVPKEAIEKYFVPTQQKKTSLYASFMAISLYLPFILALISFKLWELMYWQVKK